MFTLLFSNVEKNNLEVQNYQFISNTIIKIMTTDLSMSTRYHWKYYCICSILNFFVLFPAVKGNITTNQEHLYKTIAILLYKYKFAKKYQPVQYNVEVIFVYIRVLYVNWKNNVFI